ncbi:TPA: GIY-YIG nuclease family protein [Clostridium botulinum]
MTMGIYKIEQLSTNKIYIGSSKNIESRWKEHIRVLKNNKHHSWKLQRAWNRSKKESNFKLKIIEKVENNKDLFSREQYWLNFYQSYDENNFNILTEAGASPKGVDFKKLKKKEQLYIKKQEFNSVKKELLNIIKEYDICCKYTLKSNFDLNCFRLNREIKQIEFTINIIKILIESNIKPYKIESELSTWQNTTKYYTSINIYKNENIYIQLDNVSIKNFYNINEVLTNTYNNIKNSFILAESTYKRLIDKLKSKGGNM